MGRGRSRCLRTGDLDTERPADLERCFRRRSSLAPLPGTYMSLALGGGD
jgi:hypothetical protein